MTLYYHGTKDTLEWMQKAKPEPTEKDLTTQIGVHLEEVAEFLDVLDPVGNLTSSLLVQKALEAVSELAEYIKANGGVSIHPSDRIEFLDSLADQIVTAVGVGHCAGMKIVDALNEVNRSNFSKFDSNGTPILDNNRKIMKGPDYSKPDLSKFV